MTTNPWTFNDESSGTGAGSVTLVDGTTFVLCDRSGDMSGLGPNGLFMLDTRLGNDTSRFSAKGMVIGERSVAAYLESGHVQFTGLPTGLDVEVD